jgi:hypothetical protein
MFASLNADDCKLLQIGEHSRSSAGMTCGTSKASESSVDKSTGVSNNRAVHCCVVLGFKENSLCGPGNGFLSTTAGFNPYV